MFEFEEEGLLEDFGWEPFEASLRHGNRHRVGQQ